MIRTNNWVNLADLADPDFYWNGILGVGIRGPEIYYVWNWQSQELFSLAGEYVI